MRRLEAVIFDWAGTTIDHGSLAPVRAVSELFRHLGIEVTDEEVRADMGIYKKDHIRNLLQMPRIGALWREQFSSAPMEQDVGDLFLAFVPIQSRVLTAHARLIPGIAELTGRLRAQGLRIGSTTGYTRPMLATIEAAAITQGYQPECSYCPDDVGAGRPVPWMCLKIALDFRLSSVAAAVKVGDTPSDMEEARNAGMWAVAVAATGNEVGLSEEDFAALPPEEREQKLSTARGRLQAAGAHFAIDSAAHLEPVLGQINSLLAQGKMP